MARFTKASEEIDNLVQTVASEMNLSLMGIEFEVLNMKKSKEVVKISKASEVTEIMSNREDLIIVFVYEDAFDKVDEKTRHMWIRMALEPISYDSEKDKIVIGCPTITVPLGFAEKFGEEAINAAKLGLYTIAQIQNEEKERKEEEKRRKAEEKALKRSLGGKKKY